MVHPTDERLERCTRTLSVVASVIGAAYLAWRLGCTLNPDAWGFSLALWAAEAFGWFNAVLFFFTVWKPEYPQAPSAPEDLRVDILVPTKGEPLWVLRRTLLACQRLRYPHRTLVLDDAGRPEVRELATSLGCYYLSRPTHEHGKAGNLNFGLQTSRADFVAVLDADHVPVPEFLDRVLGYFRDPRVAFVQTPQEFYNLDSYQHRLDPRTGRAWHEQALFFRVIQPGKNHWNAAFYCGSPAILRRAALDDVGGFAVETVTEDLHTSIRMHGRGWKSVYHAEPLAYGLAPSGVAPYRIQRLRWGRGAMQILRRDNPLWRPGLTPAQRLTYLASMITWFEGWQKLTLYVAPPLFFLTGKLPIRAVDWVFLAAFASYHLLGNVAFKLASRGHGLVLLTEHYNMARFATYVRATFQLFLPRASFQVTPKGTGADGAALASLVPQATVLGSNLAAFVGCSARAFEVSEFAAAYAVNALWAAWHFYLAAWAVTSGAAHRDRRGIVRLRANLPALLVWDRGSSAGLLRDVHEGGAGLEFYGDFVPEAGCPATLRLPPGWPEAELALPGRVGSVRKRNGRTEVGFKLAPADPKVLDRFMSLMLVGAQRRILERAIQPRDPIGGPPPSRRAGRREAVAEPVQVVWQGRKVWACVEDVGAGGMRLLAPGVFPEGENLIVQWQDGRPPAAAVVVWRRRVPFGDVQVCWVGVRL